MNVLRLVRLRIFGGRQAWLRWSLLLIAGMLPAVRVNAEDVGMQQASNVCVPLAESIDRAIAQYGRGHWGISIESLAESTVLYSHNADHYFIPASNIKLLTTAAALQTWDTAPFVASPQALAQWVETINLYSHNGSAESLLGKIGGKINAQQALTQIGLDALQYRLVDGSGLSRYNMAKPMTFTQTLRAMRQSPHWQTFYRSLPTAGERGTLKYRLTDPAVRARVRAKTGTLRGVRALSGYIDHSDYGPLAFSILANDPSSSGYGLVSVIDDIVLQLARHRPCSSLVDAAVP